MFPNISSTVSKEVPSSENESKIDPVASKYKNIINIYSTESTEISYNTIDQILEKEKQHNKTETWNKLDKTVKIQKLHQFAEKYGKEHAFPMKDIKALKNFFLDCLEKSKLQKAKDVIYDKEKREITSIPALHFNTATHNFTLKIIDSKRVSTLKSLTPKRITEKNTINIEGEN
jgi:hypothetical protein